MSIVLKNISKSFEGKQVLTDFSHTFKKGERVCLMGESGIGKTTLLNIILGLVKADSGSISGVPSCITAVFQEDRLCESFSALDNVKAAIGNAATNEQIKKCLFELGLDPNDKTPVSSFSGGMRRRVAIARAILAESEAVLMDEPLSALDDARRDSVIKIILEYTKGKTLIVTTHDATEPALFGSDVLVIK